MENSEMFFPTIVLSCISQTVYLLFLKGNFSSFMQKEIFEQPESVVNTMRGRVNFDDYTGKLGGGGVQMYLLVCVKMWVRIYYYS